MALYSTKAERSALFSIVGAHVEQAQLEHFKREEARREQAVELRKAASEASQELDKAEGFDLLTKDDTVVVNPLRDVVDIDEIDWGEFDNPLARPQPGMRRQLT